MPKPFRQNGREERFSIRATRQNLRSLVDRAAHGDRRILVCRHGYPLAALVSMGDLMKLRAADQVERPGSTDGWGLDELPRILGW